MKLKVILMVLLFVFLIAAATIEMTKLHAADIYCRNCYSVCTEGGCGAGPDWECQDCKIYNCNSGKVVICDPPQS